MVSLMREVPGMILERFWHQIMVEVLPTYLHEATFTLT